MTTALAQHDPDDDARAAALRALIVAALGPVLIPALLAAPFLAIGSLLRTRRLRDRLAHPDVPRRVARVALVLGLGQLVLAAAHLALVTWILVG